MPFLCKRTKGSGDSVQQIGNDKDTFLGSIAPVQNGNILQKADGILDILLNLRPEERGRDGRMLLFNDLNRAVDQCQRIADLVGNFGNQCMILGVQFCCFGAAVAGVYGGCVNKFSLSIGVVGNVFLMNGSKFSI